MNLRLTLEHAHQSLGLIGRDRELELLLLALHAGRSVLLEGPVGAGKTTLALAIAQLLGREMIRVDGDGRTTEQKLVGTFDPALVLQKGYVSEAFLPGPLTQALQRGAILFMNELNRNPESVQNVLLPALDEGKLQVPGLGEVRAAPGFLVIATQNPREFVATSQLGEAIQDRLEWIALAPTSETDELAIVQQQVGGPTSEGLSDDARAALTPWLEHAVRLARLTRTHSKIRRGASVRAAISLGALLRSTLESGVALDEDRFWELATLTVPTRIELQPGLSGSGSYATQIRLLLEELRKELGAPRLSADSKKKP